MKLENRFIAGRMNKDLDERLVPNGEFTNAENIRVAISDGSNEGAVENVLGNTVIANVSTGTTPEVVGTYVDTFEDKIYWFVVDTAAETPHSYIWEWDDINQTFTKIMEDNRVEDDNVLAFDFNNLITGIDMIIDSDRNRRFLTWTDDVNPPRLVNVDYIKLQPVNLYTEDDVSVIKRPPMFPPSLSLEKLPSDENNVLEKFLCFAYRYRYRDQMYSVMSPFSEYAFEPEAFEYDYSTASNTGMVNKYNAATVSFNTGPAEVLGIDLIFKESGSDNHYLVESFDKSREKWGNNVEANFTFTNNKNYRVLPNEEFNRIYDNVPLRAKALAVVDNRIMFGNYVENFDIEDVDSSPIKLDYNVGLTQGNLTSGSAAKTLKSNRGYELAIVYLDEFGRATAPLTSKTNTVFVPNSAADLNNAFRVRIFHRAPAFASYYRFYVKPEREGYEVISPAIFYEDGVFTWVKLEGSDQDKVNVGDFLWVKSDTTGLLDQAVKTEVLEITQQDRNFLSGEDEDGTAEEPGVYMRIKPKNYEINLNNASVFRQRAKGYRSRATENDVISPVYYYNDPVYYGDRGQDDILVSGTYTGTNDIRYEVEIDATGTPDTFQWREINLTTGVTGSYTTGVLISGGPVSLSNGISVDFFSSTGHSVGDRWIISAKARDVVANYNTQGAVLDSTNDRTNAWTFLQAKTYVDETIKAGAQVRIRYKERRRDNTSDNTGVIIEEYDTTLISTADYANIEEWYYGDGVENLLEWPDNGQKVFFRRGIPQKSPIETISQATLLNTNMYMIIESRSAYNGSEVIEVDAEIEITEIDNNLLFETAGTALNDGIYYELGETFACGGGLHQGNVQNQTDSRVAIINLSAHNAWTWHNGYESYKVRDKLTENSFRFDFRFNQSFENYRQNRRVASILYSDRYEQTTNFNGLNVFNIFQENPTWKDIDDRYGTIQRLLSWNRNLLTFQEDKVHKILVNRSILTNADGAQQLLRVSEVLGEEVPYAGEYGISKDPESLAVWDNYIYWADTNRGTILRLAGDGISEINYGMRDFFRDTLATERLNDKIGGYDPFNDEYIISIKDQNKTVDPVLTCGATINGTVSGLSSLASDGAFITEYTVNLTETANNLKLDYTVGANGGIWIEWRYGGDSGTLGRTPAVEDEDGLEGTGTENITVGDPTVRQVFLRVASAQVLSGGDVEYPFTYQIDTTCEVNNQADIVFVVLTSDEFEKEVDFDNQDQIRWGVGATGNPTNTYWEDVDYRPIPSGGTAAFYRRTVPDTDDLFPDGSGTYDIFVEGDGTNVTDTNMANLFGADVGVVFGHLYSSTDYGPNEVDTLIAAATMSTPVVQADADTWSVENVAKPAFVSGNNLYFIWDARGAAPTANDDGATGFGNGIDCLEDQYIDINVLENDEWTGPISISIVSNATSGEARVLTQGTIRYYQTGAATPGVTQDSFTYRINGRYGTSSTATVYVDIIADSGGGGGATGEPFGMQTTGSATPFLSCGTALGSTRYHSGRRSLPSVDDIVYTDVNKNTPFDGDLLWYTIAGGQTIRVDDTGRVINITPCKLGEDDTDYVGDPDDPQNPIP